MKYGLPATVTPDVILDDLVLMIKNDKTFRLGSSYMGLAAGIGELWHEGGNYSIPVDIDIVLEAIVINQDKYQESLNLPVLRSASIG